MTYQIRFGNLNLPQKSATYTTWDQFPLLHCTGHVAAPNFVRACGCTCMLSNRPSDSVGILSPGSVTMHGVALPPAIFMILARNIQTLVCSGSVALPQLGSPDLGVDILNREKSPKDSHKLLYVFCLYKC